MLHVCDVGGVSRHFFGNVLFELIYDGGHHRRPDQALGIIWRRIQELYTQKGSTSRLTNLRLSMTCDKSSPHMHYPALIAKGATTRYLAPIIYQLCVESHSGSDRDEHRTMASHFCLKCML